MALPPRVERGNRPSEGQWQIRCWEQVLGLGPQLFLGRGDSTSAEPDVPDVSQAGEPTNVYCDGSPAENRTQPP